MTFWHEKLYFACASFIAKFIVYIAYTNVFHDRKNTAKQKSERAKGPMRCFRPCMRTFFDHFRKVVLGTWNRYNQIKKCTLKISFTQVCVRRATNQEPTDLTIRKQWKMMRACECSLWITLWEYSWLANWHVGPRSSDVCLPRSCLAEYCLVKIFFSVMQNSPNW